MMRNVPMVMVMVMVVGVLGGVACDLPGGDSVDEDTAALVSPEDNPSCLTDPLELAPSQPPLIYQTTHFQIGYYPTTDPDTPLPDCPAAGNGDPALALISCYPAAGSDPAVPDMIEDMGRWFEEAYARYQAQGYAVQTSGRQRVDVRMLPSPRAGQFTTGGLIEIDSRVQGRVASYTLPLWLRQATGHELFHALQFRVYSGSGPRVGLPAWAHHRWLLEATATAMELELVMPPTTFHVGEFNRVMAQLAINPGTGGYKGFAWFRYVKATYGIDLPLRLFNATNPEFTQANVRGLGSNLAVVNRILTATIPQRNDRLELWKRFSFALHYALSERYIPNVRALLGPITPRSQELDAAPSGFERRLPDVDEDPPRHQNALVIDTPIPLLDTGHGFSFKIDLRRVLCTTPGAPIPGTSYTCNGTRAIPDPSMAKLVLHLVRPEVAAITVYRMPLSSGGDPAVTEPVVVTSIVGATPEDIVVPLTTFRYGDEAVVSIVYDPEAAQGGGSTMALSVYFRTGCDEETIVRCDWGDGCALRDVTIPRSCRKIRIWAWGGGGLAMGDPLGQGSANGGGGGFAYLKVKNDHPMFDMLRLNPAHDGGNAATTVQWMRPTALGPMNVVAAGGGGASFGYLRDPVTWEYTFVHTRGGGGDQAGEGNEYATGGQPGRLGSPGAGGVALIREVNTASDGRPGGEPALPGDGGYRLPGAGGVGLLNGAINAWNGNGGAGYYGGGAGGHGRRASVDSQGGSGGGGGHSYADGIGATVLDRLTSPADWEEPAAMTLPLRCSQTGCRTGFGGIGNARPGGGGIVVAYE
jgi:hypothetical protein